MGIEGVGKAKESEKIQKTGESPDPIDSLDKLLHYWDSFDTDQKKALLDQISKELQDKLNADPSNTDLRNAQRIVSLAKIIEGSSSEFADGDVKQMMTQVYQALTKVPGVHCTMADFFGLLDTYGRRLFSDCKDEFKAILQNVYGDMDMCGNPKAKGDLANLLNYIDQTDMWGFQWGVSAVYLDLVLPPSSTGAK